MSPSTLNLSVAVLAFVGSHLVLSSIPIRTPIRSKIGKWPFAALYSAVSLVTFYFMLNAYGQIQSVDMWNVPTGLRHAALTLMLIAVILIVHGAVTINPGTFAMEQAGLKKPPSGIHKITRHPVSWGIIIWGLSHILANSDARGLILFSGMVILSFFGAKNIDRKRKAEFGTEWESYEKQTSFYPFHSILQGRTTFTKTDISWSKTVLALIIYAILLWVHPSLFGVDVIPVFTGN